MDCDNSLKSDNTLERDNSLECGDRFGPAVATELSATKTMELGAIAPAFCLLPLAALG